MVGTFNYLSPEVILKEKHTPGIDVWALGCIMFKMLVGKVAFQVLYLIKYVTVSKIGELSGQKRMKLKTL